MKVCEPTVPAGITLDEVTVRYGAHIAIERASFAVRPGELRPWWGRADVARRAS